MDEEEQGLAFAPAHDWDSDLVREAAKAFQPEPLDLGNRVGFAPEHKVDLGGIGDRFRPADDEGLRIGGDADRLREDLARLKEHEADLKLRALLEKAERALTAERFTDAWTHVEAALEMAPANVSALLLGARCKYSLGELGTALNLVSTARQHATDAAEVTLAARLRDACEERLVDEVSAILGDMLEDEQHDSLAIEFAEQWVTKHPEVLGLHYLHGAALLYIGEAVRARAVVEAVMAGAGADLEIFAEMHRSILAAVHAPQVERARQSLRVGRPKVAIEQLAECAEALEAEPRYARLWSYAHERYAKSSKIPFVGWRRTKRANVAPLDVDGLQDVLSWVLREELQDALNAFYAGDFETASRRCTRAAAIDQRCAVVAYVHASAETISADIALERIDLNTLAVAEGHLATAEEIVQRMAADPEFVEQRRNLGAKITAERAEVAKLTRFVSSVTRFNDLMARYEHRRITTHNELYSVRGELISIRSTARVAVREHDADSHAGRTLRQVLDAVDATLRQLRP
ncbi:tetratricopeptide repeat protein [Lentzea nigeriaca]|uniref:hypothetical protein n=1 Tax=Lentzea nigeriaca TaxID=1128665 RepID=UPI0019576A9B|nr:hypothetical protein [Lentzea nigeriaca]MBM7856263.1 tetratricopeptide (TPR) repeat protein [Lentzea nigeriaca]